MRTDDRFGRVPYNNLFPQFNMLIIAQRIQKQLLDNRFLKGIPNAQFLSYTYEGKGTDNFALIGCISNSYFDKT